MKFTSLWPLLQGGLISKSEEWMKELYAEQLAGRESADPVLLHPDAASITRLSPLDNFPGHAAWLDRGWKLHRREPNAGTAPTREFYNLAVDDRETTNLFERETSRAATMRAQLEAWLQSVARSHNGEDYRGQ